MSLTISLHLGSLPVKSGSFVDLIDSRETPIIDWDQDPKKDYVIVFYDPDASHLHWIQQGFHDLIDYTPPNPPQGETHTYVFDIFESPINRPVKIPFGYRSRRTRFDVNNYNFGKLVGSVWFKTGTENMGRRTSSAGRYRSQNTSERRSALYGGTVEEEPEVKLGDYFVPDAPLTDQQKAWYRCTLHVAAKGQAVNPWAVCSKSVGTSCRDCANWLDPEQLPDNELVVFAENEGLDLPKPFRRSTAIKAIKDFLASKPKGGNRIRSRSARR